jgi:Na+/proline symporter
VEPGSPWWDYARAVLASPYTIIAALIPSTLSNMASFGTDQDMVQRMLTATDYKKSRRSLITSAVMDIPIAGAFSLIGVLLIVFYTQVPALKPAKPNDVFGVYILNVMPVVVRGFVLAGLFATAMGSLSAALNALATSMTNDWYLPYAARDKGERHHIAAARFFTGFFAVLMVVIASFTAFMNVKHPEQRLIPIALGVAGLFLGPMLGVFLVGMLTKKRGSDGGNMLAVTLGLVGVFLLTGQQAEIATALGGATGAKETAAWVAAHGAPAADGTVQVLAPGWVRALGLGVSVTPEKVVFTMPAWMPKIAFTWYAMLGCLITFGIGVLFRTPESVLASARHRHASAGEDGKTPLALRV